MLFRLDLACKPIAEAFGCEPYLVGSVQDRTAHARSDVDVRLILSDKKYDRLIKTPQMRTMLDMAFSGYLRDLTGLPVDFQIQRMAEANERHKGKQRNPLGGRTLPNWVGDSTPKTAHERLAERARALSPTAVEDILTNLDRADRISGGEG
jgi:hypothetical protein